MLFKLEKNGQKLKLEKNILLKLEKNIKKMLYRYIKTRKKNRKKVYRFDSSSMYTNTNIVFFRL